jgi:hypothetical protein
MSLLANLLGGYVVVGSTSADLSSSPYVVVFVRSLDLPAASVVALVRSLDLPPSSSTSGR